MAKFCMFCGNQLPDIAQFCPNCGQKQPLLEPQKVEEIEEIVEEIEEESSDEMDLLSQFGYMAPKQPKKKTPPFKPTTVKKEEVKEKVVNYIQEKPIIKPVEEPKIERPPIIETPIIVEKPIQEEIIQPKPDFSEPKNPIVEESFKTEEPVILKQEKTPETNTHEPPTRRHSARKQESTGIPFQPTEVKKNENVMPVMEETEEQYDLPYDFSVLDIDDQTESAEEIEAQKETLEEEAKIMEELEKNKKNNSEPEAIAAQKKKKVPKFMSKRKSVETVDEEESFKTELRTRDGGSSMMATETLYADEVQTTMKRKDKNIEIENEDEDDTPRRRRNSEGRKQVSTNANKRKRSSRSDDINKKIYNIEQDMTQIDPEEQEYDGYYENVLPLDHGQQQKKKIDPKLILIALGVVVMIGVATLIVVKILGI